MIVIVDYGMGNSASILNMIRKAGGSAVISSSLDDIKQASAIILPGVGSFDNGIRKLRSQGFMELIEDKVIREKVPFLGICLGMQLLFDSSEEGNENGLGWITGDVKKFDFATDELKKSLKVPHMGWNDAQPLKESKLMPTSDSEYRYYFVHSFHVECADRADVTATTNYGYDFTCAVQKDNVYGVQFHPEKSHKFGMELFKRFIKV